MASPTRTLTVNFVGRTKSLDKAFKRVGKGSALMSDKLMRATRMAGIGFGALAGVAIGAAAALKPMIDKAASMEESLSKNRVVFGESAAAVEDFASKSLHAFGVTERAALEATGVIGTLGSALGMTEADSASMATTLVGLAGDMSSFNDASVEETLTAIQAGLRGESEPLRRFGVLLDAATLKAKALETGIISSTKEALTPQTKALAAYELILEQTSIQMGDFTRTADSATNQSKLLAGEWDKIQTTIGAALLPAFTSIVTHLNEEVMPAVQAFAEDPSVYNAGAVFGATFSVGFGDNVGGSLATALEEVAAVGGPFHQQAIGQGATASVWWWQQFFGGWRNVEIDQEMRDLEAAFQAAGAAAFDRPLDDRGQRPGPVPDPFAALAVEGLGTTGPGVNMPGGAALGALMDSIEAGLAMEGAFSPSESTVDVFRGDPADFAPPAEGMEPGGPGGRFRPVDLSAVSPTTGLSGSAALALLSGGGDLSRFLSAGGPPNTQIDKIENNFNITGVSPSEVAENMGKYIDMNGPLPDWWTQ